MIYLNTHITLLFNNKYQLNYSSLTEHPKFKLFFIAMYVLPLKWLNIK